MTDKPAFTIIAGINGAGKTSLYHVLSPSRDLGKRVNIDEIAMEMGSSSDPKIQIHAGITAMNMINDCIREKRSFHLETTLPGATILKQINAAKEQGFYTTLYYVGIDDVEVAIQRVHLRMAKGGHGIADEYIHKRYDRLNENLKEVLPLCDEAILFDNTNRFRQVAVLRGTHLIDCDVHLPLWMIELTDEHNSLSV